MITPLTQAAIAVINDIANQSFSDHAKKYSITPDELNNLLSKLSDGDILSKVQSSFTEDSTTYTLKRPKGDISLLDVLEATGEHINCNYPTKEEMYIRFHNAAPRLGVLNQIMRTYLLQIKLTDF